MARRSRGRRGSAAAVLRSVLEELRLGDAARGRVRYLAEGLTYRVYGVHCRLPVAGRPTDAALVVRLPRHDAPDGQPARAERERRVLERLAGMALPFRVPEPVGEVPVPAGLAVVQRLVPGVPLDTRAPRSRDGRPWAVVAGVAAACHALDPSRFSDLVPVAASRRAHVAERLDALGAVDLPELGEARAWVEAHLPTTERPHLLHGDLLGQNLLVPWEDDSDPRPGVIDWAEARIGDPAYDLAIVTRGVRRPFQHARGFEELVEAYNAVAEVPVDASGIRAHELCLHASWLSDAWGAAPGSPQAEQRRTELRGLLRRVDGSRRQRG